MKRRSPLNLFLIGFIKSFFIMAILFAAGYGSYRMTKLYYTIADVPDNTKVDKLILDLVNDVQVDDVSKNLIFCVDKKGGKIDQLVLEIFSTYTGNLDYITIPVETQYTLSNEMYQRLLVVNPDTPQIIQLSEIPRYFPEETVYDYGVILLEDCLGIDISYYTAIDKKKFNQIFNKVEKTVYTNLSGLTGDGQNQTADETVEEKRSVLVLSDDFLNSVAGYDTEEDIDKYLEDFYEDISSNMTLKNKQKYVESYLKVKPDYIYYHCLQGVIGNGIFTADVNACKTLVETLESNGEYEVVQKEQQPEETAVVDGVSSVGLNILISNSSKISGLAAHYKNLFTTDGYTVSGIDNYNAQVFEHTKIIIKSEGVGTDLLKYFNNAVTEIGDLPVGIDIHVILGTNDKIG